MPNHWADDGNCVAVWNLDNGALVVDSKGLNTLTNSGAAANTSAYQQGDASGEFVASELDSMAIADADLDAGFPQKNGDSTSDLSVCFWIQLDILPGSGAYGYIIDKMNSGKLNFGISYQNTGGTTYFKFWIGYNNGASTESFAHGTGISTGIWYHVGITYDRSSKAWKIRVWDDNAGALLGGGEASGTGSQTMSNGEDESVRIGIGVNVGPSGIYLDGRLDEICVFNDVLSSDEIDEIRQGLYGGSSPSASLSASPSISPSASISSSPSESPSAAPIEDMQWYPRWTWPVRETLVFNTQILRSKEPGADGSEQRIALLIPPRQRFATQLIVKGDYGNSEFDVLLHYWAKRAWPVPIWTEATLHSGTLTAGATTITMDTTNADWRANNKGLIFTKAVQEEIDVSAVAAGQLTVAALANTFTGEKWVMPQREGVLTRPLGKRRTVVGHSLIDVELEVIDNKSITGWSASTTYDGYDVLDTPCYLSGGVYEQSDDPEIYYIDNRTGLLDATSHSDFNFTTQGYVVHKTNRADCWELRQWLHAIVGRQKAFLVPTFRRDFSLVSAVGSSDTTVDVAHRDFSTWMGVNARRTYLFFWDGSTTLLVRKITGMAEVDSTTERLTIDAAPGQAIATTWIVGWVDKCRLGTDSPVLNWRGREKLESSLTLQRVSA